MSFNVAVIYIPLYNVTIPSKVTDTGELSIVVIFGEKVFNCYTKKNPEIAT